MDQITYNEASFLAYCRNAAQRAGGQISEEDAWSVVQVPDAFLYTCVFNLRPADGKEAELAADLKRGVEQGQLPDHILFDGRNRALARALESGGFAPVIAQTAMSRPLVPPFAQPRCRVIAVGPDRVREWVDCLNLGMGVDPTPYALYEQLVHDPEILLLAAEEEGRMVSTICLATVDGMACIHEASTLPEMRGRGLMPDLLNLAMQRAAERGLRQICLQASEMGKRVYEKQGFAVDGLLHHWKLIQP